MKSSVYLSTTIILKTYFFRIRYKSVRCSKKIYQLAGKSAKLEIKKQRMVQWKGDEQSFV